MSLSSETSSVSYAGNNSAVTAYTIPYKFFNNSDIYVKVVDADGEITVLELTTDYTLTGAGDANGGTMVTVDAWDNTHTVTIERRPPYKQLKTFREGQSSAMESMESGLDILCMQIQRLAKLVNGFTTNAPTIYSSADAPTEDDDTTRGYKVGDLWIDETNLALYVAQDVTDGAAVWFTPSLDDLFDTSLALTAAQQNQALTNLGVYDSTDTGDNGAKFERNPDGGLDLALYDQGTNAYRKIRLNNGAIIVE